MTAPTEPLLRYLRRLTARSDAESDSDAVLLERFVSRHDETAFTALLARHGPMVFGVCRRLLRDGHQAEDVFQATFLVLARKAASLRRPEALASWLYATAHHLASAAQRDEARRRQREARCLASSPPPPQGDLLDDLSARELLLALDEEMARLPETYRLPLILCHLEGRTHEEAARLLGWTAGSVKGRLERGRKQLHARLSRRGLALSTAVLALAVSRSGSLSAAARLSSATLQAALTFARGEHGGIATTVLALAESAVPSMTMTKAKMGLVLLLATSLVAGTGTLAYQTLATKQPQTAPEEREKSTAQAADRPAASAAKHSHTDVYGDPLPPGAIARMGTIRFRYVGDVTSVAFSPDGKIIASGERNHGPIILWEAATGKKLHHLDEGPGILGSFSFSPDSKQLAVTKWGAWIGLWDVATGKQVRRLKARSGGSGGCVAFSADGKILATPLGQEVVLLDARTGVELRRLKRHPDPNYVVSMAFSPDGKTLAGGGRNKTIVLWDTVTGKQLRQLAGHEKEIPSVAFSADGKTLASASHDRTVRLWDVATGREQHRFTHQERADDKIQTVHFVPGRPWLVTGSLRSIRVWDLSTGKEVRRFPGHFCLCDCPVALSPDGTKLVARSGESAQLFLWELATGKRLCPPGGHQRGIGSVAFSPDGKALFSGGWDETFRLWDTASGKELRRFSLPSFFAPAAFTPDGKMLTGCGPGGFLYFWDAATGEKRRRLLLHKDGVSCLVFAADGQTCISSGVNTQNFAADGKTLVTTTKDKAIRFWRVDTGAEIRRFEGHEQAADGLALAPDGKTLASVSQDKTARLWDVASGKEIRQFRGHRGWLRGVAYSPDSKTVAAVGEDKVIHLWNVANGEEVRRLSGHEGWVTAVRFSPDGRTLASAGDECSVRLWESVSGQERHRFQGHRQAVWALDFSRDGRRLASAGNDATALIWDVTGRLTAQQERAAPLPEKDLKRLWIELGDEEKAAHAYQTMCLLQSDPAATVRLFRKQLSPIRAVEPARIARWIADLDSAEFAVREKAMRELEQCGEAVEGALRKVLENRPSLEIRQRVKLLLAKLSGADRLRSLRAVEVLEHLDTTESRRLLETLSGGAAEARLTQEAKASLARLAARPVN